jgi:hypothetical protein
LKKRLPQLKPATKQRPLPALKATLYFTVRGLQVVTTHAHPAYLHSLGRRFAEVQHEPRRTVLVPLNVEYLHGLIVTPAEHSEQRVCRFRANEAPLGCERIEPFLHELAKWGSCRRHGRRLTPQFSGGALPFDARRMCTMK